MEIGKKEAIKYCRAMRNREANTREKAIFQFVVDYLEIPSEDEKLRVEYTKTYNVGGAEYKEHLATQFEDFNTFVRWLIDSTFRQGPILIERVYRVMDASSLKFLTEDEIISFKLDEVTKRDLDLSPVQSGRFSESSSIPKGE